MTSRAALLLAPLLLLACAEAQLPPPVAPIAEAPPPPAIAIPPVIPMTPITALERLFNAEKANPGWFEPAFIAKVPIEKIDAIIASIRGASGALKHIEAEGKHFLVTF